MKTYLAIFKKEVYHILRDTRTLFILIAMPIVQVLIFGYAVTNEFQDSKIAVLDMSHDQLSEELIHHIRASGHFIIDQVVLAEDEIDAIFKKGSVKMVLVIPAQFQQEFFKNKNTTVQFIIDGSEPNYANTLNQYATRMVRSFAMRKSEVRNLPYSIDIESRMVFNPELKSAYNFLPGTIAMILLLISAMLTSLTIAREKETGTMEILLVSPVSPLTIIMGKIGPYAILSFINAVLILLIGYYVFDVPVKGSLPLLLAMCILYVVTSLSLGILISNKSKTQQAAMMGSLISLMMPSMLLSGFIFPISSMPVILQYISTIVPTTYFIMIIKAIMLRGAELHHILHPMLVLLLMTSVFLIVSLRLFKTRLS